MASNSEWQVAGRRKGASGKKKKSRTVDHPVVEAGDSCRDQRRVTESMNELRGEDFWLEWKDLLGRLSSGSSCTGQTGVQSECLQDCVCYGLGSFSMCVSARY